MGNRDYKHIEDRLLAIKKPGVQIDVPGQISSYPFYCAVLGEPSEIRPSLLVSAGIHGDEPAGVEAVFQFLERDLTHIIDRFHMLVLPCLNPTGYVANTRENIDGVDINRDFEDEKTAESQLVKQILKDRRFAVQLDMHEDYDATGMYFYEGRHDTQWIMPEIVEQAKNIGAIDEEEGEEGETDIPLSEGLYQVDLKWGQVGLVSYVLFNHTDHVVMTETPSTAWPMDRRVAIHLLTLDHLLSHYANHREAS